MDGYIDLTTESLKTPSGIAELNRMLLSLFKSTSGDGNAVKIFDGYGSPENVVTANVGALYLRRDGGATTTLYVKTSGTGATGWTAK